jgi:hypothetical protein
MESLLLLVPLLACPLAMAALAGIAWTWAKLRGSSSDHGGTSQAAAAEES